MRQIELFETYAYLSQLPDEVLHKKYQEVIDKYSHHTDFVYFISDGSCTKVGVTKGTVIGRIKSLQSGNPRKLICIAFKFEPHVKDAYEIESWLHKEFENKHVRGEWFVLTDEDINSYSTVRIADYFCKDLITTARLYSSFKDENDLNRRLKNNFMKNPWPVNGLPIIEDEYRYMIDGRMFEIKEVFEYRDPNTRELINLRK